jgi:nitrite reductase/ring-hydroxylating ferredoxin subunit
MDGEWVASVEEVPTNGSSLITAREADGSKAEVILVRRTDPPCDPPDDPPREVAAWRNFCQHETDQRLDRGSGAAVRDGEIVCPKHGSMFDVCSGHCDNGKAAGSTLVDVDVTVEDGAVYLTDPALEFLHEGGIDAGDDEDDDVPGSSSHLTF